MLDEAPTNKTLPSLPMQLKKNLNAPCHEAFKNNFINIIGCLDFLTQEITLWVKKVFLRIFNGKNVDWHGLILCQKMIKRTRKTIDIVILTTIYD